VDILRAAYSRGAATSLNTTHGSLNSSVHPLIAKYPGKVCMVSCPTYPNCEIVLCGTVHVSNASVALVEDAIQVYRPHFVVLELCPTRVSTLCRQSPAKMLTMKTIVLDVWEDGDWSAFGMNLLSWLQTTAGHLLGSPVGGEQNAAAHAAKKVGAAIVLGDRNIQVTVQRMMDRLKSWQKLQLAVLLVWETLTSTAQRVTEYIKQCEAEEDFVQREMEDLAKHMPVVAEMLMNERDEYIAQTIHEIARTGLSAPPPSQKSHSGKRRILAVLGAAHLSGVQRRILGGGVNATRIREISASSKHPCTWPGEGMLPVVNTALLYSELVA
jgi:pheromone shutdown protein TraB